MGVHRLPVPMGDDRQGATEDYKRRVRIACDDLHDDPLDPAARAAMLELLNEDDAGAPLSW
jgi:hypothetical protein